MRDSVMEDFAGLDQTDPTAVVVGLAPEKFDYAHINSAFHTLFKVRTHCAMYVAVVAVLEHGRTRCACIRL